MSRIFVHHHTVTEDDIDDLGHAGNYHYIKWMQHAAIAHSAALGWPKERYDGIGSGWVVRSHEITYLKPAFKEDAIAINTWVANMKSVTSLRCYEIYNGEGDLLAKANTDWAFVNYQNQKPRRIPPEVMASFEINTARDR